MRDSFSLQQVPRYYACSSWEDWFINFWIFPRFRTPFSIFWGLATKRHTYFFLNVSPILESLSSTIFSLAELPWCLSCPTNCLHLRSNPLSYSSRINFIFYSHRCSSAAFPHFLCFFLSLYRTLTPKPYCFRVCFLTKWCSFLIQFSYATVPRFFSYCYWASILAVSFKD